MTHYIDDKLVTEMTFYPSLIADAKRAGVGLDVVAQQLEVNKVLKINDKTYKLEETK